MWFHVGNGVIYLSLQLWFHVVNRLTAVYLDIYLTAVVPLR